MRIVSGFAKGRKIKYLEDASVRPTTDKVKEAIFSMLQFDIEGTRFLDLFAGSGQMGIEALSRGAKSAVFIDENTKSCRIIKENISALQINCNFQILNTDAVSFLSRNTEIFDIAFLDPPYKKCLLEEALPFIVKAMSENGIIVCEHLSTNILDQDIGDFTKYKTRKYGNTSITVYRHKDVSL